MPRPNSPKSEVWMGRCGAVVLRVGGLGQEIPGTGETQGGTLEFLR